MKFTPFIDRITTIIDSVGKYKTRSGEIVEITKIAERGYFNCYGVYADGIKERWRKSGHIFESIESVNDIVGKV